MAARDQDTLEPEDTDEGTPIDWVVEASRLSFPASDPPAWPESAGRPAASPPDEDG